MSNLIGTENFLIDHIVIQDSLRFFRQVPDSSEQPAQYILYIQFNLKHIAPFTQSYQCKSKKT